MAATNDGNWVRAIRGPITLITLGGLFVLNNFYPGYGFERTWPVLLIVFGLLSLLKRGTEPPPPPPPVFTPQPPPPNYNWVPPVHPVPPSGGYSGSTYSQPASTIPPAPIVPPAPAKGGFGTTTPREAEPTANPPAGENA